MSTSAHLQQKWLIAYDIADAKRLQRAHRYLTSQALPLQNSVFLFRGSRNEAENCFNRLKQILNRHEDDLRIYPLPANGKIISLGRTALPEGLLLSGYEENLLQD